MQQHGTYVTSMEEAIQNLLRQAVRALCEEVMATMTNSRRKLPTSLELVSTVVNKALLYFLC